MNRAKDFARQVLPRRAWLALRRAAIRAGIVEPVFQYPFWDFLGPRPKGRPQYLWGTLCGAFLARELGIPRISVIEFGVAGGTGLVYLEDVARRVQALSGVVIDVYGFDTGVGLPKPFDHRDLPQLWHEGDYRMDVAALKRRLSGAQLELGPVAQTVPAFLARNPAPVGFAIFDMDLYSSTMDAFRIFEGSTRAFLPRVTCYFDDIMGFSHGDHNGERLAIADFNRAHERRKLSPIYGLERFLGVDQWWVDMMYLFHAFDHERYADYDGSNRMRQMPLR